MSVLSFHFNIGWGNWAGHEYMFFFWCIMMFFWLWYDKLNQGFQGQMLKYLAFLALSQTQKKSTFQQSRYKKQFSSCAGGSNVVLDECCVDRVISFGYLKAGRCHWGTKTTVLLRFSSDFTRVYPEHFRWWKGPRCLCSSCTHTEMVQPLLSK